MTRVIEHPGEEDESLIRDFLLGKTPEVDRERLEERLLGDPDFSEMVSAIEEELIDDYTAGLLFNDERQRFETCFLVTEERRRRVQFSASLARVKVRDMESPPLVVRADVFPLGSRRRAWMQVAAAAVAAISLGTTLWMAYASRATRARLRAAEEQVIILQQGRETLMAEHRHQLAEAEALARAPSPAAPLLAPSLPERVSPDSRPVVVAALTPGVLRATSSNVPSLHVSPSTLLIEFQLELAEDTHPGYKASVHDASGNEIFRAGDFKARTTSGRILVSLQVPAAHLPRGDYSIRLWGNAPGEMEELDRYYVRIVPN